MTDTKLKEARMALFLAERMGLAAHEFRGQVFVADEPRGDPYLFHPATDKAQLMECVLFAAKEGHGTAVERKCVWSGGYAVKHDNTDAGIMAATITAICRALGYDGEE